MTGSHAAGSYTESAAPAWTPQLSCLWSRTVSDLPLESRIVPDGCVDVIWNGSLLWVAGPDTRAHVSVTEPGTLVGARFRPGGSPGTLGLRADLLRDGRVPLADVWPARRVRELAERLADTAEVVAAQRVLAESLVTEEPADPVVDAVRALAGAEVADVSMIADAVGLSERQLHRRCVMSFGYGPKTLHKVLRFQRALGLARKGTPLAETAVLTGYSDQAHLSRDVRALAGVPMRALLVPQPA